MLEAVSLNYSYGRAQVLHDVSFTIEKGETLGIIGPNGSGKSTLLRLLSGITVPASGDILLLGKPLSAYPRKKLAQAMAVLTQEPLPSIDLTVSEVVRMGRFPFQNWLGGDADDVTGILAEVIEAAGIGSILNRPLSTLSGGERQRVAIAKAMVQQPQILLLDEPTTFLDIASQVQMLAIIKKWQIECGLSVVLVLHDLNLAAHVCDRLLLLHKGRKIAEGAVGDVLTRENIYQVFGVKATVAPHPNTGLPQVWIDELG
jgi:iron complex transport system ATP-binding protein